VAPYTKPFSDYPEDYFTHPLVLQKGFEAAFYPDFIFTYPFSGRVYQNIKNFKPDLIHFHAPFTVGYQAIRIAKKLKIPVIGTFHTFFAEPEYLKVINMENSKFLRRVGWTYSNMFFDRCDEVVSPGIVTADFLVKENLKTPVTIVSNGVEVDKYANFNFTGKFPLDIDEKNRYLIYVGRISEEKCLRVLFESVDIIKNKHNNIRLIVVGGGPFLKKYKDMVNKMSLNDYVHFTGMIPNKDFLESGILKKMEMFVTPSTSENQPMTIIEAIMFGLPIVGADAKGNPELIEDNGFKCKPNDGADMADKIIRILEDDALKLKFSQKSLQLRDKYNIVNTSNKMEALYYKTLNKFNS
ncbi:MAG TPA: glycosyltransferase, partial [Spirochaetota bacterium]|nr:glycosyltransferase [Spirochaetota bacterium]